MTDFCFSVKELLISSHCLRPLCSGVYCVLQQSFNLSVPEFKVSTTSVFFFVVVLNHLCGTIVLHGDHAFQ